MLNRIAAELLLFVHFAFILFALFGGLLVLVEKRWAWAHIPTVLEASLINLFSLSCPLTPLENRLQRLGGRAGYQGGFIEHYLTAALYPAGLTREAQLALGTAVLALNLIVYGRVVVVSRLERRRAARGADV